MDPSRLVFELALAPGRGVREDQWRTVLPGLPAPTVAGDIRPRLFNGELRFFEAQSFAAREHPHRVVRYRDPPRRQFVLEAMQRQMRFPAEPVGDESPVRLKNPVAVAAHQMRGLHQGQRSSAPRKQAGHMTASRNDRHQTNLALASKGPSTHDSTRPGPQPRYPSGMRTLAKQTGRDFTPVTPKTGRCGGEIQKNKDPSEISLN